MLSFRIRNLVSHMESVGASKQWADRSALNLAGYLRSGVEDNFYIILRS